MMSDEDLELRELVARTLENNGTLSKIRAELRASVFLALEEHDSTQKIAPHGNLSLKEFLSTKNGSLVLCLVREFLEYFELDYTLSVFDPETSNGKLYQYEGRKKLISDLEITKDRDKMSPVLAQILQLAQLQCCKNQEASNMEEECDKTDKIKETDLFTSLESSKDIMTGAVSNSTDNQFTPWDGSKASTDSNSAVLPSIKSTPSCLGPLPPLNTASKSASEGGNLAKLQTIVDLELGTLDNYEDDDFHSSRTLSGKSLHDSDSEIEEDIGSGLDDAQSLSIFEDITADKSRTSAGDIADYMENCTN